MSQTQLFIDNKEENWINTWISMNQKLENMGKNKRNFTKST